MSTVVDESDDRSMNPAKSAQLEHSSVDPQETLFVKGRKRFVTVLGKREDGVPELTLHIGDKAISFDEPPSQRR